MHHQHAPSPRSPSVSNNRASRLSLDADGVTIAELDAELYEDVRGDRGADAIAALEYDDLIAALHVCIVDVAAMEDIMVIAISSVVADGFMRKPRAGAAS